MKKQIALTIFAITSFSLLTLTARNVPTSGGVIRVAAMDL